MSFLAPLFLLGALAIAGPIIFHLIRRTTREVTPFSSLMFLQPTPPRVTRKSRLENILLLVLRCLVIALLAAGFARPFIRTEARDATTEPGTGVRRVVLIDTSASMRRGDLWMRARAKAKEVLEASKPSDEVALLAFDRGVRSVFTFEEWRSLVPDERLAVGDQRLALTAPSWGASHLDDAIVRATEMLEQPAGETPLPQELIVISDLQEGSRLNGLQGFEWPKGLRVALEPMEIANEGNTSLQWVADADENAPAADDQVRVRVATDSLSKREQFKIEWSASPGGETPPPLPVYVPPGQSRIVRPPAPPANAPGKLWLTGDSTDFDNQLFVVPAQSSRLQLVFIGRDAEDDPKAALYYLRRAFPPMRRQVVEIVAHAGEEPLPAVQLEQAQLLVLGSSPSSASVNSAREFASNGKVIVAPLGSASDAAAVGRLLNVPALTVTEAAVREYALLAEIDFQHPLFSAFADPRFSDFTKIHFWKYRRLDPAQLPGARVIARFEGGDPAIVQTPIGKGSAVIFTSSWNPADSQLALSSKFVPLLHALLEQSTTAGTQKAQYFVGDEVTLPEQKEPFAVRKPDGSSATVNPGARFAGTDQPGIYTVTPGNARFAVNLAPEESRTIPLAAERLTALGVPLHKVAGVVTAKGRTASAGELAIDLERRQKLWRWLIVAALIVVLLETVIARRLSANVPQPAAAST